MAPFSHFAVIAASLTVIAACSVVALLKSFGFWRWIGEKVTDWAGRV